VKGFILRATGAGDPNIAEEDNYENLREAFEYLQTKQIPIVITTQAPDGVASMEINEPRTISIKIWSNTCLGYEYGKYGYKTSLANR
jgi:L-asparaginase/Glu-tRNA(Gln) amidotransferase subunit D